GDELDHHVLDGIGIDRAERGHCVRDVADLVVVELFPDRGAALFPEREHQHGAALGTRKRFFYRMKGRGYGHGSAHAGSASHWRMMDTVSVGLRSASSPTFCRDWACTLPLTCAISIMRAVGSGGASAGGSPGAAGAAGASIGAGRSAFWSGARMRRTSGRTTMSRTRSETR